MASAQQMKDLQAVFNSFDADGSGSIEAAELGSVVEALGGKMEPDQIRKIMKQLDINKDGKISFEEFKYWWETGHEGPLGNLVFLRAKSMKLTNSFLAHLSQAGVDLGSFAKDKSDSVSLHLQLGEPTKEGMGIKCSVSQGGSQFAERLAALKKECPDLNAGSFNLLVLFGSDSPAPSRAELHSLLTDVFQSAHMPVKFEDFEDNEFVSLKVVKLGSQVGVHLQIKEKMAELVQAPLQLYDQIKDSLGEQSTFKMNLSLGAHFTIDQLLEGDNLIQTLSKGCSIKFDAEVPSGLMKKGRELMENAYLEQQQEPPMLLSLLLRSLKLRLKLRSPEQIEKFFQKLGIKELLTECPTLGDLLEQLAMFPEVAELKLHVESPMHFLYRFLKFCNTYVRSECKVYLQRKDTLVEVHAQCPNASKIYKSVFNEL